MQYHVYNGIVSEREREERKREIEREMERVRENWEECGMGKSGRN